VVLYPGNSVVLYPYFLSVELCCALEQCANMFNVLAAVVSIFVWYSTACYFWALTALLNSDTTISTVKKKKKKNNAPVLVRSRKLKRFEPAQYWGGGPPGNSVVLYPYFFSVELCCALFLICVGSNCVHFCLWIQRRVIYVI